MCLGYIVKIIKNYDFEIVIFDTAPTGHTLRLLNFPNLLGKGLEKLISLKENFSSILNNVGTLMNSEMSFDKLFSSLDSLKSNIEIINTQFKDTVKLI
jgi:arsenite-transporting ATPase